MPSASLPIFSGNDSRRQRGSNEYAVFGFGHRLGQFQQLGQWRRTVAYADLVSVLDKAYTAKAVPPFCWLFHPHAFFSGVHGMLDLSSRPIVREGLAIGVQGIQYSLFGFPVYVSANFPVNQTYGSGSNKTYGAFLNPNYVHLGEDPNLQIMVIHGTLLRREPDRDSRGAPNGLGVRTRSRNNFGKRYQLVIFR